MKKEEDQTRGFKKLIVWKNTRELRKKIYEITKRFSSRELRRVSQMRDAARSVKQNIQEGYSKNSLGDYMRSLEISKGSLAELMGDIDDCLEDGLITEEEFSDLDSLSKRTHYLFDRLLTALHKKSRDGTWQKRWPRKPM